jgi:hypothetical protein
VRLDDLTCEHEPEARPADAALAPDVAAEELREDPLLMLGGMPRPSSRTQIHASSPTSDALTSTSRRPAST